MARSSTVTTAAPTAAPAAEASTAPAVLDASQLDAYVRVKVRGLVRLAPLGPEWAALVGE
jgi:hypothetical protein